MKKDELSSSMLVEIKKKSYTCPKMEIDYVEMEEGIASGSAQASPGMTGGNVDQVSTEWDSRDDSTIGGDWLSK
ncbi:hypothetical protein [Elizabethkingia sp. M8]|uniref:hypothetical protein n=2 Tax=Elizabethkingia TaxID=308865 RepID=UPI001F41F22A|nr:hypothetical protein [Elizabethkingia sp. M8]MDV3769248.1 hypothetical protein [Elizabethkingia anophelis]MDV3789178.1 hypothetical protein [Elizabethkingia anophelis]